jgi:hypothetical protein
MQSDVSRMRIMNELSDLLPVRCRKPDVNSWLNSVTVGAVNLTVKIDWLPFVTVMAVEGETVKYLDASFDASSSNTLMLTSMD